MSGGCTSELYCFSLVCSVVLGFSSVLVLVFTFVLYKAHFVSFQLNAFFEGFLGMLTIR